MTGIDADGRRVRAGDRVQWEDADGTVRTGLYRTAWALDAGVAIVVSRDDELVSVPHERLRVQTLSPTTDRSRR